MLPYSLKHLIKSSKTTEYQEQFNKQFEQILNIESCLKQTVKSIRRFTDPNPRFTLMSSFIGENKMNDADLFSDCLLRMKQKCINTSSEKFLTSVALAESALEEAKGYIYDSDLKRGDDHFRKVLSVRDVDRSEGLSLTMDVLPTECQVSSEMTLEQVYSDACPTTTEEYEEIECHLKLDHSKTGQIECTYYGY
ncbi:hypothetical protein T11_1203 [Trichinella zimbabwensis]|uniref:BAR domain-containing protein n=1 Tax=Trichinella zimbabwensis TaxID=268475 RepID=A0A0V1I3I7_9BILA|nr:hypothetical protein T11_1203 [Trichinella zimbabwensis]